MGIRSKVVTLEEAVASIENGAIVAIGGHTLRRHPMALVREIIRQGKSQLHIAGWNNGIDVDMLVGARCAAVVETSYVGMGIFGLAQNFRRASQSGHLAVVDHSETTAIDMFRASAFGVSFAPTKAPLGTDIMKNTERFSEVRCPFTGDRYAAVKAVRPDVALIHAHTADQWGNVQLDREQWMDTSVDVYVARAANRVICSVEQIVSDEYVLANPDLTFLPRSCVSMIVEAPFGAHPCCCDARYDYDLRWLTEYYDASRSPDSFDAFVEEWIRRPESHTDYLDRLGTEVLMRLSNPLEETRT
jgi:glutaconate CoA-transferase, subunit A